MAPSSGTSGNSLLQYHRSTFLSVPGEDDQPTDEAGLDDSDSDDADDADDAEWDTHREEGDDRGEDGDLSLAAARASRWTSRAVGLEVHVRPTGNDATGDGTPARPFATVKGAVSKKKSAIERATKPTYMYVSGTFFPPDVLSTAPHGGDTTVTVSAPEDAPLIITPRDGATARFEGRVKLSDIMDGGWQAHKPGGLGGHIYSAKLTRPVWQLWRGDKSLTVARYPDVGRDWFEPWPTTFPLSLTSARGSAPAGYAFERGQRPPQNSSFDDYAEGTKSTGYWGGWFTTDGGDSNKAIRGNGKKNAEWRQGAQTGSLLDSKLGGFDFTGGILHSRMCHKTEFWHPLPITSHQGKRINFRADIAGKVWKGPDACTKGYKYPEKFYIEALDALNLPGEWWYDRRNQRLYVYLEGGVRPDRAAGAPLMAKVNDLALDFTTSENVVLRGLEFFGTFAMAGTGGGGRMEGNSFLFPNYPRHILWENKLVQNQMTIKNQHFVDNDIRFYTYGASFTGPLVHVENNLLEFGIYGCGPMGCGAVFVNDASRAFVARTTVRYTQQWHGIVWLTPGFEGAYNHVHDVSTVRDDASLFQTKYAGERKSHMHHNWAYNSELKGVRYDTCGDKSEGGHPQCGGAIWNNVFFNSHQGGNVKGDYQLVVGNTAFANGQRVDLTLSAKGVGGTEHGFIYNKFSRSHNNAVDILSKHDGRCQLPVPGWSSNNYAARCRQDSEQATTPIKDLMRDPYNFDFRPKDRRYPAGLLQGAKTNVPKFATINGNRIDLSGGPDIGAYQHDSATYWIPGKMFAHPSTPVPPHTTTTARADLDLMFLEGRGAERHDVYLSRNACLAWAAGRNSPQHVARLSGNNIVRRGVLGDLRAAVWYYWRVDAVAADGTVRRGPLWCFAVGAGDGGCDSPPCGDWAATTGQACATDSGSEDPIAPAGCGSPPATTEPPPTPPPASETTTAPPETTATTAAECKDSHWKCKNQWKNKCHKWGIKKKCPMTCGDCTAAPTTTIAAGTTPTTPTTPTAECKDRHWKCPTKWKNKCHKQGVFKQCPLTCGSCTP